MTRNVPRTVALSRDYHRPTRQPRLRRRARWWKWMLCLMLGAGLFLAFTWRGISIDASDMEKAKLSSNLEELQRQQKHLKSKLTTLRSFARIDKIAREKLNMVYADQAPRKLVVPGLEIESPNPQENNGTKSLASK